jgi:hypothetical protein
MHGEFSMWLFAHFRFLEQNLNVEPHSVLQMICRVTSTTRRPPVDTRTTGVPSANVSSLLGLEKERKGATTQLSCAHYGSLTLPPVEMAGDPKTWRGIACGQETRSRGQERTNSRLSSFPTRPQERKFPLEAPLSRTNSTLYDQYGQQHASL